VVLNPVVHQQIEYASPTGMSLHIITYSWTSPISFSWKDVVKFGWLLLSTNFFKEKRKKCGTISLAFLEYKWGIW